MEIKRFYRNLELASRDKDVRIYSLNLKKCLLISCQEA